MAKAKKKTGFTEITPENIGRRDRIADLLTMLSPSELNCSLIQFLNARRYVQRVLWSLGLKELDGLSFGDIKELFLVALGSGKDAKRIAQLEWDKWQLASALQGNPVFGHGEVKLVDMDIGGIKYKGTTVKI